MSLSRTVIVGLLGLILMSIIILLLFALDYFITGLHLSMYAVYILIIMTAIFALLAIEDKDLLHAALYLAGSAVTLALIYLVLFAIWVAFFQLAIYAGAVTVIIISGISLTTRRGTGEIEEEDVT
jgi:NADH:ubiquinone oxidoreductase subunit 6 (subunit J)